MSNSYTATLGSLSTTPAPGVPNPYQATEPNQEELGMKEIGSMGTIYTENEKNVVLPFIAMPWDDGHHRQIRNGDILFISRHKEGMRHNIVEWFKLNEILRRGYELAVNVFGLRDNYDSDDEDSEEDDEERNRIQSMFRLDQDTRTDIRQTTLSSIKQRYLKNIGPVLSGECHPSAVDIFFKNSKPSRLVPEFSKDPNDPAAERSLKDQNRQAMAELRVSPKYTSSAPDERKFWELLFKSVTDEEQRAYDELLALFVEHRDSIARYLSVQGILRFWNLLGTIEASLLFGSLLFMVCSHPYPYPYPDPNPNHSVCPHPSSFLFVGPCNNTAEGKGLQDLGHSVNATIGNAPVVNVIIKNHARVFNRWGNVTEISQLHAVLTRRRLNPGSSWADSKWGEYQIVPWFSDKKERPPHHLMLHKDLSKADAIGHDWEIGKVDRRTIKEAALNIRTTSCGLIPHTGELAPSGKEAYDAKAKLDMIEIFYKG